MLDLRPVKEAADVKYTEVRLLDDSLLHCQSVAFRGNDVNVVLLSGTAFKVPLGAVTWVLQEGRIRALHKKFDDIVSQKSKRDRIIILRDRGIEFAGRNAGRRQRQGNDHSVSPRRRRRRRHSL